jgi:lysophospholipase L1-like esterase
VQAADAGGRVLPDQAVAWTTADPAVATVSALGVVTAGAHGVVALVASSGGVSDTAVVTVLPVRVATVRMAPARDTIDVGSTVQFQALAHDSAGNPLADRAVAWESSAPLVVAVSAGGLATARAAGDVTVTAASEGARAQARLVVRAARAVVPDTVLLATFGDSNTDYGYAGTDPSARAYSYVSHHPQRLPALAPHSPLQLAGKIERRWAAAGGGAMRVVNHGIGATTTGGGAHGGPNRTGEGAPQARTVVDGVTRYEAEVLGRGYPWSGGEPANSAFPDGGVRRVAAFTPRATSFAYVSLGTNDPGNGIAPAQTIANLQWMVDAWVAAGHRADHLVLTTLAPFGATSSIPEINDGIRALARRTGAGLIDLAAHTSADNGLTWRSSALHVGEERHYSETVRDWLAEQVVAYVRARAVAP